MRARGVSLQDAAVRDAARSAGKHVEHAFQRYFEAWREQYEAAHRDQRRLRYLAGPRSERFHP